MKGRLTKLRVAIAALFVLAGVGLGSLLSPLVGDALATVGQTVNISDHSASAYFASVSSDGKLAVGDGAGPLSVDGTVASRAAAPASPWFTSGDIGNGGRYVAGPSTAPINITSLSFSTDSAGGGVWVALYAKHVPTSATSCSNALTDATIWNLRNLSTPVSFAFPTPLQWKPLPNTKACLYALASTADFTPINAVGFYGG